MITTSKEINIYKYGNENNYVDINVLETWQISEQQLLLIYEPIFAHYLKWSIEEKPNEKNFVEFMKFLSSNNSEILFQNAEFSIYPKKGLAIETHTNKEIELDCMILFEKTIISIKRTQLWFFEETNPIKQYYSEI